VLINLCFRCSLALTISSTFVTLEIVVISIVALNPQFEDGITLLIVQLPCKRANLDYHHSAGSERAICTAYRTWSEHTGISA